MNSSDQLILDTLAIYRCTKFAKRHTNGTFLRIFYNKRSGSSLRIVAIT